MREELSLIVFGIILLCVQAFVAVSMSGGTVHRRSVCIGNACRSKPCYRPPTLLATPIPTETQLASEPSESGSPFPDMEAYSKGFATVFKELPYYECKPSVGQVPADLKGTYFRAGPAMFSAGSIVPPKTSIVKPMQPPVPDGQDPNRMVKHPFEGDGAVLAVSFANNGDVTARFRYVRTAAFINERKKGQRIYTAMDTTRQVPPNEAAAGLGNDSPLPLYRHHFQPGLNKNRKNTSNTRTIYWGKRLFSLWEGGKPYKLDGLALQTEGPSMLGGAIRREDDPFSGKMAFDASQNRALFYGIGHGVKQTEVTLYEFDASFRLVPGGRFSVNLPGFALINDLAVTENYAVLVQPNIAANPLQFAFSKDPGKILSLREENPATVHLIPRPNSNRQNQVSIPIPIDAAAADAHLQFCNAYEEGDDVVLDVIRSDPAAVDADRASSWPWASSLNEYQSASSRKSLWRYTVDVKQRRVIKQLLWDIQSFFATFNPATSGNRHRYVYLTVGRLGSEVAPPQGLGRLDLETGERQVWMPQPYEFCGEPMYAPSDERKGEDSGYIVSVLYNGKDQRSDLVILRAADIAAGPCARLPLGICVPHGLFGCFTTADEARWPFDEIMRRAKLADKIELQGNRWNEVKSDFSGLGLRFDDMEEYFGDFFS